jgi:hypothetical protein
MDWKWYSQFNALLNMLRTLFIVFILAVGVFVFNRDASNLVLVPIERMLKRVKDVSENPLAIKQVPCTCIRAPCTGSSRCVVCARVAYTYHVTLAASTLQGHAGHGGLE